MQMNFCRRCGAPLTQKEPVRYECANGHTIYNNPLPTVGIFFINQAGELVLPIRGKEPNKGKSDSFGGFIDVGESASEALARELQEELSLDPSEYSTPEYLITSKSNYTFGGETRPLTCVLYWAHLLTNRELVTSDDVAGIRTFPLDAIDMTVIEEQDTTDGITALRQLLLTTS